MSSSHINPASLRSCFCFRFLSLGSWPDAYPAFDSQLFQQLQEPLHRSRRFDAHHHRTLQGCIKPSYCIPFVGKGFGGELAGLRVHHSYGLLSWSSHSLIFHLGLLHPSLLGWIRKVFSICCGADVVMTSVNVKNAHDHLAAALLPRTELRLGTGLGMRSRVVRQFLDRISGKGRDDGPANGENERAAVTQEPSKAGRRFDRSDACP